MRSRLQSAMEYLMTYGWAILIIAVVLIGLSYLGIFNSLNFAPKATAGSCYVLRTAAQVSLAGECNGYIPKYMMYFGTGSSATASIHNSNNVYSFVFWVYDNKSRSNTDYAMLNVGSGFNMGVGGGTPPDDFLYHNNLGYYYDCWQVQPFTWELVDFTFNNVNGNVNFTVLNSTGTYKGCLQNDGTAQVISPTPTVTFGSGSGWANWNGYISNMQIYNTTLSPSTLQSMYSDGVGAAPIQLQNLVAWYPLNGDVNDYSGNGNNGAATNPVWLANWYQLTSYTPT